MDLTQDVTIVTLLLDPKFTCLKTYLVGAFAALFSLSILCIIFVGFNANFCNDKYGTFNKPIMNRNTTNHTLIIMATVLPTALGTIAICWFIPSILCLYQLLWNRVRLFSWIYAFLLFFIITYFFYGKNFSGTIYLLFNWSVILSLFSILGMYIINYILKSDC